MRPNLNEETASIVVGEHLTISSVIASYICPSESSNLYSFLKVCSSHLPNIRFMSKSRIAFQWLGRELIQTSSNDMK